MTNLPVDLETRLYLRLGELDSASPQHAAVALYEHPDLWREGANLESTSAALTALWRFYDEVEPRRRGGRHTSAPR